MKKLCTTCDKEKDLDLFYKNKSRKDGHSSWCKSCDKEYNRKYYIKNKEKRKKQSKEWEERKRKDPLYLFDKRIRRYKERFDFSAEEAYSSFLDKPYCYYCNTPLTVKSVQMDHATPTSRGGSSSFSNIRFSCSDCNRLKSNRTESEFFEFIKIFVERFNNA